MAILILKRAAKRTLKDDYGHVEQPFKLKYVSRNGKRSYWFADPDVCHCLYVGSQHNYDEFQQFKQKRAEAVTQANEQRIYDEFMASPAGEVFYGQWLRPV
jgi:hypothetical protein